MRLTDKEKDLIIGALRYIIEENGFSREDNKLAIKIVGKMEKCLRMR